MKLVDGHAPLFFLYSRSLLALWLCLSFWGASAYAQECTRKTSTLPGAWQEHRHGEFIFQYTLEGEHALLEQEVKLDHSVPAVVLDAALQMLTTRALFQSLGYQLPLDSARYKGQGATLVLVRFVNIRGMGLAFDEGMARWSEAVLVWRDGQVRPVPQTPEHLALLWQASYSVFSVWNALAEQCDPNGYRMPLSAQWRHLRYSNGDAVAQGDVLPGHGFMLRVLKALGVLGERLSSQERVPPHRWPEVLQGCQS